MNHTAHLPHRSHSTASGAALSGLAIAARDALGLLFVRGAHAFYAPPPALRFAVSPRARRYLRGGE